MSIANNIKKLREIHNLSQKELAEIAGVTDKAVSTWENGIKEPRMGAIQKIADHFCILKSNIIEEDGILDIRAKKTSYQNEVEISITNAYLSEHELKVITEYRNRVEMQSAIDTLLGIKKEESLAKNVDNNNKKMGNAG